MHLSKLLAKRGMLSPEKPRKTRNTYRRDSHTWNRKYMGKDECNRQDDNQPCTNQAEGNPSDGCWFIFKNRDATKCPVYSNDAFEMAAIILPKKVEIRVFTVVDTLVFTS